VLGKFKDEYAGKIITHVICPKPKMYCVRYLIYHSDTKTYEEQFSRKMKGISRTAAAGVEMTEFQSVLETSEQTHVCMTSFRSLEHRMFTEIIEKKALNGLDTKRFGVDNINTLAFGHNDILKYHT